MEDEFDFQGGGAYLRVEREKDKDPRNAKSITCLYLLRNQGHTQKDIEKHYDCMNHNIKMGNQFKEFIPSAVFVSKTSKQSCFMDFHLF